MDKKKNESEPRHNITSVVLALELLKKYSFTEDEINEISRAIRDHRKPHEWKTRIHQSVYLADKLFEHMGAYITFRAGAWVGETGEKYSGPDAVYKLLDYCKGAEERIFLENNYPKRFEKLTKYQFKWMYDFMDALKDREEWIIDIVVKFFKVGENNEDLEQAILNFKPSGKKQELWHKETLDYIQGRKFEEFGRMVE
ncbi:MAG: hypothetical protein KJ906_02030 [Nanoarchaeota archaeon]|nr:hypothetical protein [Nanoarchaeota archaeon]